jgi:hypothetical protein
LRTHLVWIKREGHRGNGSDQVELTGVWPPDHLKQLAPPDRPWPEGLPRQCRIILDGQSLWPGAIEWWGPVAGNEALLARTEYLQPKINQPLTPQECDSAFSFDPGNAEVSDRTSQVTADLSARAQELWAEKSSQ